MPIDPKRILLDDAHLLAVMKLSGELVVAGKGRMDRLPLLDFLRKEYPGIHPIHRLDFETSGVVFFAKSRAVLKTIVESRFAGWTKRYIGIALGHPRAAEGIITKRLPARSGDVLVDATTHYRVLKRLEDCSLVECTIERGQRHQIRRHLQSIGHPLILDDVYGDFKANRAFSTFLHMRRFFLHAASVDCVHPVTGHPVHIECAPPPAFLAALKKLTPRT